MEITSTDNNIIKIGFTVDELTTLCNCMNEASSGLVTPQFAARVGVEKEEALKMLDEMLSVLDRQISRPT